MAEHLRQIQIEDYCRRRLSGADLLFVSDHMAECDGCRHLVVTALHGDAAFFALRSGVFGEAGDSRPDPAEQSHPDFDRIAWYVDGALSGEEMQAVIDHTSRCARCALAVEDLRSFSIQGGLKATHELRSTSGPVRAEHWWNRRISLRLPSIPRFRVLAFGSGLAALVLIVTGWLIWQSLTERRTEGMIASKASSSIVTPAPAARAAAPVLAQITDGAGPVILDREGRVSGIEGLNPGYQVMVREALTSRLVPNHPSLSSLNRPRSSLMGPKATGAQFSVIDPVGKLILSARPTFRWSWLDHATSYVVEVYDDKFNLVAASPPVAGNSWAAPRPFNRGATFSWQVRAIRDGQEIRAPLPPSPQAEFRVLDREKALEIAEAQRTHASSHLLLGLLYAQAGLPDEAEREFQVLQKLNPDSKIVAGLLRSAKTIRR